MKPSARKVLDALRKGQVLTPLESALSIGVHALSQRVGELRRDASVPDVIVSERVPGKAYHKYYIKDAIKFGGKEPAKPVAVKAHTRKTKGAAIESENQGNLF